MSNANGNADGVLTITLKLVPLLLGYLFLFGWTFYYYYFASFGLDERFVDIGFYDTVVKGLTVLLHGSIFPTLLVLFLFLAVSAFLKAWWDKNRWLPDVILLAALLVIPICGYRLYRSAGLERASIDQGPNTKLPNIVFKQAGASMVGKLVYLKGDTYFIHDVRPDRDVRPVSNEPESLHQLSILKASELSDVKVIEHGE